MLLRACCAAGFVVLGLAARQDSRSLLQPPRPAVPLRPERLAAVEGYGCASCHAEVAEEWARSAHALAWVDEAYRAELATKRRPELCHGCHVPEPLLANLPLGHPAPRDEARELGVSCESCHADGNGTMLGPRGTSVEAHPSRASEHMRAPGSNELCSACHSTTIGPVIGIAKGVLPILEERGLSCVGCHMAPLERSWAHGAPERLGRSHALQTPRDPAFLRLAFGLELHEAGGKSVLAIRNQAGHRVPGLVGRELRFEAELRDADGAALERAALVVDDRAYLPLDGVRELRFAQRGASVRVLGLHRDPRAAEPVTFLEEVVAPD